jgi:hypothetical protein
VREQVVEHRHANDEPASHLLLDEGVGCVGDRPVDLDTPVHRARVHDLLPRA